MQQVVQLSILPFGMINSFLIKGTIKHVLIDSGVPGSEKKILKQIESYGLKPEDIGLLVITHGHLDHFGSAGRLSKILNIPVLVHELDAPALLSGKSLVTTLRPNRRYWNFLKWKLLKDRAEPVQADIVLKGNEEYSLKHLGVDGSVVHTPGHTPGSLSVILDNGEAIIMDLASSGIFLGGIAFRSRMKHPPFHDNKLEVKNSLGRILQRNTSQFYLGHGYPVSRELLTKYAETMLE